MESNNYFLRQENKRVSIKEEDMFVHKIATIFQVVEQTLYLTDDTNTAIFPEENDGHFSSLVLADKAHYEVCGDSIELPGAQAHRFSFTRPPATAASGSASALRAFSVARASAAKALQRTIFIATMTNGKPESSQSLVVRFPEFEASVEGILSKVCSALGGEETYVLTDGQGNMIVDSEGTRGSAFWKQNARKIYAVKEEEFRQSAPKRRRTSRREDTGLDEVKCQIEEVVLASQGLGEVLEKINQLVESVGSDCRTVLSLTSAQVDAVKHAFACVICTNPVNDPYVSMCCNSITGCGICIHRLQLQNTLCPKCRAENFNPHKLVGLAEVMSALGDVLKQ